MAHLPKVKPNHPITVPVLDTPATAKKIIGQRPLTVVEAMRELNEVRAIPVTLRGKTTWVRTDIAGNANKLLLAIGRKPPPKVLNLAAKCSDL